MQSRVFLVRVDNGHEVPKTELGSKLLALDAFLAGYLFSTSFPAPRELFDALEASKESDGTESLISGFVRWKKEIPARDIIEALEGEQHLPHVIAFAVHLIQSHNVTITAANNEEMVDLVIEALGKDSIELIRELDPRFTVDESFEIEFFILANDGKLQSVKYLLDEKPGARPDIHAGNDKALRWATAEGQLPVVQFLLDERQGAGGETANIHAEEDEPFLNAVEGGHTDVILFLLENRVKNNDRVDIRRVGRRALQLAEYEENTDVYNLLVEKGATYEEFEDDSDDLESEEAVSLALQTNADRTHRALLAAVEACSLEH